MAKPRARPRNWLASCSRISDPPRGSGHTGPVTDRQRQPDGGRLSRLPLIGDMVGATRAVAASAASAAVAVPRSVVHAILDDIVDYFTTTDLTRVVTSAIDLNQIVSTIDLDSVLARVDLNALLGRVDLNAMLSRVDLDAVLAGVDLNALLAGVDLNPVLDRIDVDGLVSRIDVDALLNRTDVVGLAEKVIDGVDLNTIVRDASASVSTEMINDVRTGSERADDGVEQFVNRMLRRKDGR